MAQRTASTTLRNSTRTSVAGALDHASVVHGDCRIDQVAAERPQPRQRAILVRAREPAVADHVGREYRREFPGLGHDLFAASRSAKARFARR